MPTDPKTLPAWNGRPVPWIARWTGEVVKDPYSVQVLGEPYPHLRVVYPDGRGETREENGVLWQREGLSRRGEPQFAQVNTYRQRLAMRKRLCQVCGTKIEGATTPWILDSVEGSAIDGGVELVDGDPITTTAPTCEDCIEVATKLCPHLRKNGFQVWDVLDYEIWGVFGEVVAMRDGKPRRFMTSIEYEGDYGEGFSLEAVFAKQQVVKITKYRKRS